LSGATSHAPNLPPLGDDGTAVAAMARGDTHGLAALYGRYAAIMLATARRILGDPRSAEDVVHDVFLEAWRQAVTYDPDRGTVRTWLLVRLRSRALDRCRAAVLRRTVAELPDTPAGDDSSELPDHHTLRAVLAALPADQRTVLEHAYFAGLSASEIATLLQIPIGTVKSRLGAGLKKLRSALSAGRKERP
jgi:RNA polymerase sigma-70 factor, ECF subfamily